MHILPTNDTLPPQSESRAVVAHTIEALIFAEILKPLASSLGPMGDAAIGSIAKDAFVREPS